MAKGLPKWAIKEAKRKGAKNIFAYAWTLVKRKRKSVKKGAKRSSKSRRKSNPKRVRKMARRKKNRGKRKFTIPLAVVAGVGAGFAQPIATAMKGDYPAALGQVVHNYTGFEGVEQGNVKFNPEHLKKGLLPLIVGVLIHKFVGGPPLNVNRSLAAAGVPIIRI